MRFFKKASIHVFAVLLLLPLFTASSFAARTQAPGVTTNAATSVTATGEILNGNVTRTGWRRPPGSSGKPTQPLPLSVPPPTNRQVPGRGTRRSPRRCRGLHPGRRITSGWRPPTPRGRRRDRSPVSAACGRRCSDGGDLRGLVGDHDRRGSQRRRELERAGDEWVVRMGHQSDPGHLQPHSQPVPGGRDVRVRRSGDAVGAYIRDDVLLPGGGLQLRGDVEGVDRQSLSVPGRYRGRGDSADILAVAVRGQPGNGWGERGRDECV